MKSYPLQEIAKVLEAELVGDLQKQITGIAPIQSANSDQITFLHNAAYAKFLPDTKAAAVIVSDKLAEDLSIDHLKVADAHVAFAKAASLFAESESYQPGIAASAVIGENCQISEAATIEDFCKISNNVKIGSGTVIKSGVVIERDCEIGSDCIIHPNVVLYPKVILRDRVIIHGAAVIGADGFGFARDKNSWLRIPQLGGVNIGNDVEVGASTCIDRGALADTIIEDGVKLDNQIQIGHNVRVGKHTVIAGGTAIAGSADIGCNCMIGGDVSINGHLQICDGVRLAGTATVSKSIKEPGLYGSGTGLFESMKMGRLIARFRSLDKTLKKLSATQKYLQQKMEEK